MPPDVADEKTAVGDQTRARSIRVVFVPPDVVDLVWPVVVYRSVSTTVAVPRPLEAARRRSPFEKTDAWWALSFQNGCFVVSGVLHLCSPVSFASVDNL